MTHDSANGKALECPLAKDWADFFPTVQRGMQQIAENNELLTQFNAYLPHLRKLDRLETIDASLRRLSEDFGMLHTDLIQPATGRNQVPLLVVVVLLLIVGAWILVDKVHTSSTNVKMSVPGVGLDINHDANPREQTR